MILAHSVISVTLAEVELISFLNSEIQILVAVMFLLTSLNTLYVCFC